MYDIYIYIYMIYIYIYVTVVLNAIMRLSTLDDSSEALAGSAAGSTLRRRGPNRPGWVMMWVHCFRVMKSKIAARGMCCNNSFCCSCYAASPCVETSQDNSICLRMLWIMFAMLIMLRGLTVFSEIQCRLSLCWVPCDSRSRGLSV